MSVFSGGDDRRAAPNVGGGARWAASTDPAATLELPAPHIARLLPRSRRKSTAPFARRQAQHSHMRRSASIGSHAPAFAQHREPESERRPKRLVTVAGSSPARHSRRAAALRTPSGSYNWSDACAVGKELRTRGGDRLGPRDRASAGSQSPGVSGSSTRASSLRDLILSFVNTF
jgi:hypothetical protein